MFMIEVEVLPRVFVARDYKRRPSLVGESVAMWTLESGSANGRGSIQRAGVGHRRLLV